MDDIIRVLPKLIMVLIAISYFFKIKSTRKELNKKSKIYTDVSEIPEDGFCLFLRTFSKENDKIQPQHSFSNMFFSKKSEPNVDIFLFSELKKYMPILKIVNPDTNNNEDNVSQIKLSNKNWKDKVSTLMHKSNLIIINPLISDGLIWELNQILNKTLFIITKNPYKSGEKRRNTHFFNLLESSYGIAIRHNKNHFLFGIENMKTKTFTNIESFIKKRNL